MTHTPSTSLTCFEKGVYCMGIQIFNMLPFHVKDLHKIKGQFKNTLKDYLFTLTLYYVEEYFNVDDVWFILVSSICNTV